MRRPKPWFRTSKNAWYVQYRGKKVLLGLHPEDAAPPRRTSNGWNVPQQILDAFYKLMAADPANLPKPDAILTCQVCDLFLDYSERHNDPATYRWYKHFLQSFTDLYGRVPAADLKPLHVTRWLDAHEDWKGGRRNAVTAVKRAFNWADKQGVLAPNPLRNVEKPPANRRTRIVTPDERAEILAAVRDQKFRDFLSALYQTGCRPSEVAKVTAAHVNLDLGVWVFENHKTAKKTGKPRVVYLSPAMVEWCRTLVTERPTGPLFPSYKLGRPFTRNAILTCPTTVPRYATGPTTR